MPRLSDPPSAKRKNQGLHYTRKNRAHPPRISRLQNQLAAKSLSAATNSGSRARVAPGAGYLQQAAPYGTLCSPREQRVAVPVLTDESRYRILRLIEHNPAISQRELARELGISLGKVNFCLNALIEKGILKASSFLNSRNKRAYAYFLTPWGIDEKARVTLRFLRRKVAEYETLQKEIADLAEQARKLTAGGVTNQPVVENLPTFESKASLVDQIAVLKKKSR